MVRHRTENRKRRQRETGNREHAAECVKRIHQVFVHINMGIMETMEIISFNSFGIKRFFFQFI